MAISPRPNPASFTPALTKGAGLLPWTDAYTTARQAWTSAWRAAQSSWVGEIRAAQAALGYNSANLGNVQLQGIGSERNYDYVAKRWTDLAGSYVVGKGLGKKVVVQSSVSYRVAGLEEWLKEVDAEFRQRVMEAADRRFAAWLYRQSYHEKQTISYQGKKITWEPQGRGMPAKMVVTPEQRSKEYTGWPVGSGFSRASLIIEWDNTTTELKVRLRSLAPYTLAAPVTRAVFNRLKRELKQIIPGFAADVKGDLEVDRG